MIKFEAEIDLTKSECRVKQIEDPWMDFGYCLEITGFMLRNAAKYREQPIDELIEYATKYLKKAAEDYKIKQ